MPATNNATSLIDQLKDLETWCARAVWDVTGTLTKSEVNRLYRLRRATGMTWDAVNCVLNPWTEA